VPICFGCVIAPALVCFAWMTILGGTAIDLELSGVAECAIIGASNTAKLFATLSQILSGGFLSAITIMSGGEQAAGVKHRIV